MRDAERQARERLRIAIADLVEKKDRQALVDRAVGEATRLREIALADRDDAIAARNAIAVGRAKRLLEPVLGTPEAHADIDALPLYQAEEQLAASDEALRVLGEEADVARTAVLAAEINVKRRAAEVINVQAEVLGAKLVERQEDVAQLRHMLFGLSYIWLAIGDVSGPWRLSETIRKALDWTEPYYVPGTDPVRASTADWQAYLDALCENADAGPVSLQARDKD
jgi:hypothetical protein